MTLSVILRIRENNIYDIRVLGLTRAALQFQLLFISNFTSPFGVFTFGVTFYHLLEKREVFQ